MRVRANRCPFCHEDARADDLDAVACAQCLARHHRSCWDEGGACAACGGEALLSRNAEAERGARAALVGQEGQATDEASPRTRRAARGALLFACALLAAGSLLGTLLSATPSVSSGISVSGPAQVAAIGPLGSTPETLGCDLGASPGQPGALLTKVYAESAAYRAGLRDGDLIQSLDGRPIRHPSDLRRLLAELPSGREVRLGYRRGELHLGVATLTLPRARAFTSAHPPEGADALLQRTGAALRTAPDGDGVLVDRVLADAPAQRAGLRPGDRIESADQRPVRSLEDLDHLHFATRPVRLGVRDLAGLVREVVLELPPP
ncbi:MAG: PDZ domain-containing protein [Planctomycetota bacterium]|nr:MAG: PDZ domain-containing protein [Planctomycetota bacterium]